MNRPASLSGAGMIVVMTLFTQACGPGALVDERDAVAEFPTTLKEVSGKEPRSRQLELERWETDEGARVLFMGSEQLPMVDLRLVFNAGAARDGDHPGLASLTSHLLDQGADGMDVDEIARGFEDLGARFDTSSHRDMGVVNLTVLSEAKYREPAVELFRRVVSQPDFPEEAVTRARNRYLQSLRMETQVPGPQVERAFYETLYGEHPYGSWPSGNEESIPRIGREQLREFHRRYYTGANAVIAIVGDLDEDEARELAARISASLPEGDAAEPVDEAPALAERSSRHIDFDSGQTHIHLGNTMVERGHPDYAALHVGNHILGGGGFTSLLMDEVRQRRGLVYGIRSGLTPMASEGPFRITLQTANHNADDALGLTLSLVEDFVREGPTQEQVDRAVDYLTGSFALSTASNSQIVGQLGSIGFYDLPLDHLDRFQQEVRAITPEQVHRAMREHLDPQSLAVVSIGPARPELPDSGELEEIREEHEEYEDEALPEPGPARDHPGH